MQFMILVYVLLIAYINCCILNHITTIGSAIVLLNSCHAVSLLSMMPQRVCGGVRGMTYDAYIMQHQAGGLYHLTAHAAFGIICMQAGPQPDSVPSMSTRLTLKCAVTSYISRFY